MERGWIKLLISGTVYNLCDSFFLFHMVALMDILRSDLTKVAISVASERGLFRRLVNTYSSRYIVLISLIFFTFFYCQTREEVAADDQDNDFRNTKCIF